MSAEKDRTTLGRSIRETREELTMTPAELADEAGIDREHMEALEAGRVTPADDVLRAISRALGLDSEAFVTRDSYLAAFGARVRTARMNLGLSQEAAARRTGLHRNALQRMESGALDPRLTSLQRLARGLRVPLHTLTEQDGGGE